MPIDEDLNIAWTRKHDNPGVPYLPSVPRVVRPKSLPELLTIARSGFGGLRASGSHWALSDAAVSDETFIETHDPTGNHPALGATLHDVVPECMDEGLLNHLLTGRRDHLYVHVEAGKRIYQLYAELDYLEREQDDDPRSLRAELRRRGSSEYRGAWAFETLGAAGGQTVVGAITTGTHGGDHVLPPIADSVVAIHLVADGGKQFWIEPDHVVDGQPFHLTDPARARAQYGSQDNPIEVVYDDNLFNAVLVSAGRFGIIYSMVLRAVRQYGLHEHRELSTWDDVKTRIADPADPLFAGYRFLQIALNVTPHAGYTKHLVGITKRTPFTPTDDYAAGRRERRGDRSAELDPALGTFRFSNAGNSYAYDPAATGPGLLDSACANADFLLGLLGALRDELKDFVEDNTIEASGILAGAVELAGKSGVLQYLPQLAAILAILGAALDLYHRLTDDGDGPRLGQLLNDVRGVLLGSNDPAMRAAGLFVWHAIAYAAFKSQQAPHDYSALSFAVLDNHNYKQVSCEVNVDSIEVFFAADDPMLIAYLDALLAFEVIQEVTAGRAFVGYISLRFTRKTRALLGMQRFDRTCAVEIACLRDVEGSQEFLDYAVRFARDRNVRGIFHWGQRNDCDSAEIQDRFGDPAWHGDQLTAWRNALHAVTDNGRLNRFSSAFTRRLGLE